MPGGWRVGFDAAYGAFETSHVAECPDVAPECATAVIPPHEHHVRLALHHYELTAQYGLRPGAQLTLRLPYDIKAMGVRYTTLAGAPFVPPYGDIHHRTETLTGISDPSLGIDFALRNDWIAGAGVTLPLGRIEPNPVVLGREGKTHEHIQFGSGTFEPQLALQWKGAHFVASGQMKLSLYENREGFRAPSTFVWSAGPSFRVGRIGIDPRLDGQMQNIGRWNGEIDEGSGFSNGGLRLQLSFPAGSLFIAPSVYRELFSHGRAADETFRQRTTYAVALSRAF